MAGSVKPARLGWVRAVLVVAGLAGLVVSVTGVPAQAAGPPGRSPHSHRPLAGRPVPARGVSRLGFARTPLKYPPMPAYRAVHASWPSAASSMITLTGSAAGRPAAAADRMALRVTGPSAVTGWGRGVPVFAQRTGMAGAGVSKVNVRVFSHARAAAADVRGVLLTARAAAGGPSGVVRLGISYAGFSQISGGYYGAGLGLSELPACVLVTPHRPACQKARPMASVNDWAAKTVSARVPLAGGTAGQPVVIAVDDTQPGGGGPGGTSSATSLSPSGTWAAGGSSGSFTYSYPMSVPPAVGGLQPTLSLDYDSGMVDGQTADTQPQPSWVGDGWTLPQPFVEQSFTPCQDKPEGTAAPQATQDDCYGGPVLSLSMSGQSGQLVCPASTFSYTSSSTCAATDYQGEVITHHVGSGNGQGTKFTDYWTVTTRDGTTYYFGLNHLPGWANGDTATNSVDSVPVFSAHAGDPCYSSSGLAGSMCPMAYRWNLDYVTDVHGDAMAYYYTKATNAYVPFGSSSAVSYDRDSFLHHIDYGFTDGNAYTGHVPDQVEFGTGDRCVATNCDPISKYFSSWADVPYQQDYCAAGASSCPAASPTFWSEVALTSVITQQWNGTAYVPVDSWKLTPSLPAQSDGTASLWLKSITRTGSDTTAGGTAVPLPAVTFGPVEKANRVNPGTSPFLYRNRIGTITTETGSVITVSYELPDPCVPGTSSYPPTLSSNTMSCFPEYWGTFLPGSGADWFNKWAVGSVQVSDPAGRSPGLFTSYRYKGAAWHYDDNEVVKPQFRTYAQWRGYQDVTTYSGNSDPLTESETTYYQGMSDDNNTTAVMLPDSQGGQHEDVNQLAGDVLETTQYDYGSTASTPPVNNSQIYSYWVSAAYMSRSRAGLPDLTSNATGQVEQWTRQEITDTSPATWRKTETDTRFFWPTTSPYFGLPEYTFSHGDLSQSSQQTCTTVTYAPVNTALNLVGLPAETEVDAAACTGANPNGQSAPGSGEVNQLTGPTNLNFSTNVISDTRTFYDNPKLATTWPQLASPAWPQAAPGNGDASVVQKATGYSGGAFTYRTTSASVYDSRGRVTASYDGNGGFNGTTYTPTTTSYTMSNGSTTALTVTNPLGQVVTTKFDPLRQLPVATTDANGISATMQYDGLGRLIDVWDYNRPVSATPNSSYSYSITNSGPSVVTTRQLNDAGGQVTSTALYDSLLRIRQTQVPTPQGGSLVTDHIYDSHGWETKTNTNWFTSGNPGATVLSLPDNQVPDQTVTQFDGLGQPSVVTSYDDSAVKSVSHSQYTGDKVITVPAAGATPQAVTTDALGRQTQLDQYTSMPSVSTGTQPAGDQSGFTTASVSGGNTQSATYHYNTRGWQSDIKDQATGEDWSSTYNQLGQVITSQDPSAGTSSMTYDADGNVTSTTNADGKTISFTYDPLGRKTGEFDGPSPSSPPIAAWAYDNSNNKVPGMTNPVGQVTTETSHDSAGNAYTVQSQGFNVFGESLGATISIPATAGAGALAGNYTLTSQYTPTTGLPSAATYPASPAGGSLPAETVQYGYCTGFDLGCTLSSKITENGHTTLYGYAQNTTYTDLSQVGQEEIGSTAANAQVTSTYDAHTGDLADARVTNSAGTTTYDDTSYAYDPSGNITSQTDQRDNAAQTEVQCFTYDTLDRLTSAWTADGTHACSAGPSTGTGGTVSDGIPGGDYWTSWAFNNLGDRTTQTQHSVTGGTSTVTSYTYNNGNGTSTGQPDTLTQAATTGPGAGTYTYTYDAAGNLLTRNLPAGNQTLTWYDDGKLKTDSNTTYIYDADGNLLLQENPALTTLYIFGEHLTLTSSGAVTGTRFLPLPGGGTVVRTGDGTSYSFELSDQHGTSTLTLDNTAANPAWRQFTPYGAPRGTTPGAWPDTNGFLGDPTSTSTGLTTIGARQYDPATGRFLSVDPVLEQDSPQQLNGYTYAADNPVSSSDPSGQCPCLTNGNGTEEPDPNNGQYGGGSGSVQSGGYYPWQAPGTSILPTAAQKGYQTFYKAYAAMADLQPGGRLTLGALEGWCGGQVGGGTCGQHLTDELFYNYEASIAPMMVVLDESIGGAGGLDPTGDYAPEEFKALNIFDEEVVDGLMGDTAGGEGGSGILDLKSGEASAPEAGPASRFAVDSSGVATDLGPRVSADRPVVLGESMAGRVIPAAQKLGADWYQPPTFTDNAPSLAHNRYWVNEMMNQGRGIIDIGAAPGRVNFPGPTSPWYAMEFGQVAQRSYPYYMLFPWDH